MILSQGYRLLRTLGRTEKLIKPVYNKHIVRGSHHEYPKVYRTIDPPNERDVKFADICGSLVWGWIIYHFINNYGEIIGEFPVPDPSLWTDEELGIPPDDADV